MKVRNDSDAQEFAKLALRLITILDSEASVERVFSQKRPITIGKFASTSVELANARLIIKSFVKRNHLESILPLSQIQE